MKSFVVAGIGTGIGKTIISSILVEALQADYWKPIQAGDLEESDTLKVKKLISNGKTLFHSESYRLKTSMSPHAAAKIDRVEITLDQLQIPKTENTLIIELAGGLMVPLNEKDLNIDLLKKWNVPVVLVSQNYLGSINHTLLSLELLKTSKVVVAGIIFNGEENLSTQEFILNYSKVNLIGRIDAIPEINKSSIKIAAEELRSSLLKHL